MSRFIAAGLIASALLFSGCKPYSQSSVWNQTAASKGTVTSSNPYASQFGGTMIFGGGPGGSSSHDHLYAKPIYLATDQDPCRSVTLRHTDWNNSNTKIPANACVPVPDLLEAAGGSDGHVTVVSFDLNTAWDFWRCKIGSDSGPACTEANVLTSGYQAANGSQWDLHGSGVASCCGSSTSRGSGTELVDTVLRAGEAQDGIGHAMGFTVPNVSSSYVNPPAVKSDGNSGTIRYGMLFVLRADYPETGSVGRVNVIKALKTYGAYIVDQGASFELDTAGDYGLNTVGNWQSAGISRNTLPLNATDLRYVSVP